MTFMAASHPDIHILSSVSAPNALSLASLGFISATSNVHHPCDVHRRDPGPPYLQSRSSTTFISANCRSASCLTDMFFTPSQHTNNIIDEQSAAGDPQIAWTSFVTLYRQRCHLTYRYWLLTLLLLFASLRVAREERGSNWATHCCRCCDADCSFGCDKRCNVTTLWRRQSKNTSNSKIYALFPLNSISSQRINSSRVKVRKGCHKRDFFFYSQNELWRKAHHSLLYVPGSCGIFLSFLKRVKYFVTFANYQWKCAKKANQDQASES